MRTQALVGAQRTRWIGGTGLSVGLPDRPPVDGKNYSFVLQDGERLLGIKTEDETELFLLHITGAVGDETIGIQLLTPDGLQSAPVQNGTPSSNYQFTTDNYLRFRNFTSPANLNYIAVHPVFETSTVGPAAASAPSVTSDANTFNALFTLIVSDVFLLFRRVADQTQPMKPWIRNYGGGSYGFILTP